MEEGQLEAIKEAIDIFGRKMAETNFKSAGDNPAANEIHRLRNEFDTIQSELPALDLDHLNRRIEPLNSSTSVNNTTSSSQRITDLLMTIKVYSKVT